MASMFSKVGGAPSDPGIMLNGDTLYVRLSDLIRKVVVVNDAENTDESTLMALRVSGGDNSLFLEVHAPSQYLVTDNWEEVGTVEPGDFDEAVARRNAQEKEEAAKKEGKSVPF